MNNLAQRYFKSNSLVRSHIKEIIDETRGTYFLGDYLIESTLEIEINNLSSVGNDIDKSEIHFLEFMYIFDIWENIEEYRNQNIPNESSKVETEHVLKLVDSGIELLMKTQL